MFRSPLVDAIVVLFIAVLILGPKKLPQLGRGLGQGMREFKDGITGDTQDEAEPEKVSLKPVSASPPVAERSAQTTAAPGREAGSEPRG